MDPFLAENKDFLTSQIERFKVIPDKTSAALGNEDIVIAARLRPLLPAELETGDFTNVSVHRESSSIAVHELRRKFNGQPAVNSTSFRLDSVYGPDSTSQEVYGDLVSPLIRWTLGGGVGTLFAYGQTGSGKTFTVSALEELAAADIMSSGDQVESKHAVHVCVVELEGSAAYDLLNEHRPINVLEDAFGETQLVGAIEHKAESAADLRSVLSRGMSFRKTEATEKNETSSRTHAVCRLRITNLQDPSAQDGLLFLVDLAGSEVTADSKHHSRERMKETRDINLSLSTLKDCIRGRSLLTDSNDSKKQPHIPWRASLLTKVLKHVFDPSSPRTSKTAVLACLKPSAADIAPSKNTLRYAEMVRAPTPKSKAAVYNPNKPRTWNNEQLRVWITANSGSPPMDAVALAPTESGQQLLKLPKGTFLARCRTAGEHTEPLLPDKARAFYDKLWRLHVDSRGDAAPEAAVAGQVAPWHTRIKPGMFVRTPRAGGEHGTGVVMIMAPERSWDVEGDERKFVCCSVLPTVMMEAYELGVGFQMVLGVREMEEEVEMEWDSAVRYWFMHI